MIGFNVGGLIGLVSATIFFFIYRGSSEDHLFQKLIKYIQAAVTFIIFRNPRGFEVVPN